jgi:hypothetical protein
VINYSLNFQEVGVGFPQETEFVYSSQLPDELWKLSSFLINEGVLLGE